MGQQGCSQGVWRRAPQWKVVPPEGFKATLNSNCTYRDLLNASSLILQLLPSLKIPDTAMDDNCSLRQNYINLIDSHWKHLQNMKGYRGFIHDPFGISAYAKGRYTLFKYSYDIV